MKMAAWKLAISADGRSIVTNDGSPFFWLADTAWDLFIRLNRDDANEYLENRSNKGFTVIQAVAVMGYHVPFNTQNMYGKKPFEFDDPLMPAVDKEEDYWTHVDFVIDTAAHWPTARGKHPSAPIPQ